ncbi:DUF5134 domain-containing protein [Streptomyces sp. NRRL B-24484]|uniref:DUF5134 domain-containing protein n=1 Tax=Streptomyces sp. NRRL B-24484 TaxID=1463833 RepID=UPI0004BF927F|nr:DUF5134 domain-containing protein [Streptomyces sp. NRRL B-24484]
MHGPAVVTWMLAGLAAGSAALCALRLRRPGCAGAHREADAAEAAMAVGMAGMAVLPGVVWGWFFTVMAGALVLGALAGRAGRVHRLHHGVGALAMAYMALAMAAAPAGSGHLHHGVPGVTGAAGAPMGLPVLTGALLLYFGGYSLWAGSRLLSGPGVTAGGAGVAEGGTVRACRVAMGIGMFAMLLTL